MTLDEIDVEAVQYAGWPICSGPPRYIQPLKVSTELNYVWELFKPETKIGQLTGQDLRENLFNHFKSNSYTDIYSAIIRWNLLNSPYFRYKK